MCPVDSVSPEMFGFCLDSGARLIDFSQILKVMLI
jgi:hypothetical protein